MPIQFPIQTNRISTILNRHPQLAKELPRWEQNTYPIADASLYEFISQFILLKQRDGTVREQQLYSGMKVRDMVTRLLVCRPLVFMGRTDQCLLLDGSRSNDARLQFDQIGTELESGPFTLNQLISYDEMRIATLIGIATATPFINQGGRSNRGIPEHPSQYIDEGVYTGLVGARFERPERMEYSHMLITPQQNTNKKGYGVSRPAGVTSRQLGIWASFYGIGDYFPSYDEAREDHLARGKQSSYYKIGEGSYLHTKVYQRRLKLVLRPFLLDAERRGIQDDRQIYLHAVGLGLGVWAVSDEVQGALYMDALLEIIREESLAHLSDIDCSWFPPSIASRYPDKARDRNGNQIQIHYTRDEGPATRSLAKRNKLLVAMYAWDGNAHPGNEYWEGHLTASGDPAAACCSCIAELGNPAVNKRLDGDNIQWMGWDNRDTSKKPRLTDPSRMMTVNVGRWRVAFSNGEVYTLRDYQVEAVRDLQRGGTSWRKMIRVDRAGIWYIARNGENARFFVT